ncbi:type I-E CRISPR-associated protein Cas6/Cse3/CasE [Microtetraspora malaysiensis]|uniref:type I-E CRISPR-associated protein Cas6/Cse3/CasE n=1 Tax=Microtetraspora malaysiensis TaxID=161358 RepID=UPI003D8C1FF3
MFLSKLKIDVVSREFRRDYADVHQMHRTVMAAFPQVDGEQPPRQEHGVLWRLDQGFESELAPPPPPSLRLLGCGYRRRLRRGHPAGRAR